MTKGKAVRAFVGVALAAAAIRVAAQGPQIGLIGPLPAAAPAATFDVTEKSIVELLAAQRIGTVTSHDLVEKYLARISAYDQDGPRLNAMIVLNPRALEEADALDAERRAGRVRGPLHGIPIVVKDNYATADMPTTAGSLALAGFQTGRDAFMVKKLKDAGAVIIGKTNLHELAYGITTDQFGRRADAQPVRSDAQSGRIERRHRAPRSRRASPPQEWAPIPAAPSATRPRRTACSGFAARPGCRAATASSRSRTARTSAGRWRARSPISS